jgi:hypothetical protein
MERASEPPGAISRVSRFHSVKVDWTATSLVNDGRVAHAELG